MKNVFSKLGVDGFNQTDQNYNCTDYTIAKERFKQQTGYLGTFLTYCT